MSFQNVFISLLSVNQQSGVIFCDAEGLDSGKYSVSDRMCSNRMRRQEGFFQHVSQNANLDPAIMGIFHVDHLNRLNK
jgi:hypothetical protein